MKESTPQGSNLTYTGLILISGEDAAGIAAAVLETLTPFKITILDIEQIVIRSRLLLTLLIQLNPAHGAAVESDLMECAEKLQVDIAISFAENGSELNSGTKSLLTVQADQLIPEDLAIIANAIFQSGGNIESISRVARSPYPVHHFQISGSSDEDLTQKLSQISSISFIECALLPSDLLSARKLFVLDVDSTLIDQEVIDLLAAKAGVQREVAAITESAMRGELDFAQSLAARVLLLKGLPISTLANVQSEISLTPGAVELIATLQELGHPVALVTGGFSEIVAPLAQELNIHHLCANSLEIKEGYLTGAMQGPIVDRAAKAQAMIDFAALEKIPLAHTVAIGDGANDLDMLKMSGLGIAFMAKPILIAAAQASIKTRDLARVLTLLGISRKD